MHDLLLDSWNVKRLQDELPCSRHGPVTNVLLWLEGYAVLVAVLSMAYPTYTPDLMAYMKRIIWAASNFEGNAWVTYDACYHRRAARTRSLEWSVEDVTLAQEAFAGRARAIPQCSFCLSRIHASAESLLAPEHSDTPRQEGRPARQPARNLCGLYNAANGNQCRYRF
jgi:hypothetical protein